MKYTYQDDGWRWWFALIPFRLDNGPDKTWVWLEWYRYRFAGLYYEIELQVGERP